MGYFRLRDYEIDTLPYVPFENSHNPRSFGRSYSLVKLYALVSRKHAVLAGLDEELDPKTQEGELLKCGRELFEEE